MRRKRRLFGLLFFGVVVGVLLVAGRFSLEVAKPVFSQNSGFFEEAFYLEMTAPAGGQIYYSLDGSEPNENSNIYSEPILIRDTSNDPNRYACIDNVSGLQVIGRGNDIYIPQQPIRKATVVRARVLDSYGKWGEVVSNTYFVGMDVETYGDLPIISLIVDPEDLFGEEGIYVNGEEYDNYIATYINDPSQEFYGINNDVLEAWNLANWFQRGEKWEKDASFTIFNNKFLRTMNAKIKINGGMSRIFSQKPFGITIDDYNGEEYLNKEIKLRQGGSNNLGDFLNDYIVQKLASNLKFDTQNQEFAVVFLNGEYWGLYTIFEKYSADYFRTHYGIRTDNLIMVKSGQEIEIGKQEDIELYNNLMQYIKETDFTEQNNYTELCDKIDIESFIELYCTNVYFSNLDFIGHNIACWCYYDENNLAYSKWKWMIYDCDTTFNADYGIARTMDLYRDSDVMFGKLLENGEFREAVIACFEGLQSDNFNLENIENVFDKIQQTIVPVISEYYDRVGPAELADLSDTDKVEYFVKYMDKQKSFLKARCSTAMEAVYNYFGLRVYDLSKEQEVELDFSADGNGDCFVKDGIYPIDGSDGRWAQENAEIGIKLSSENGLKIDMSENSFADDTTIKFNGETVWVTADGTEALSNIIVEKNLIRIDEENVITISTSQEVKSFKDKGVNEDTRIMAHRIRKIIISEFETYDVNDGDIEIDFCAEGNGKNFIKSGFYAVEGNGRWTLEEAKIAIGLVTCDALRLDLSGNMFVDDTTIKFNGKTVWTTQDGVEMLSNIIVKKEYIYTNRENIISISTSQKVKSPKEQGLSEDDRALAHRMKKIVVSKLEE